MDTPEVHGGVEPYGQVLRYDWLKKPPEDPTVEEMKENLFNARLVAEGYAQASSYPPDVKHQETLRKLEKQAREGNRGLWGIEEQGQGRTRDQTESSSTTGSDSYSGPYDPHGSDRNCWDFSTHEEAQAFFRATGGPQEDPHRLDRDGDGMAYGSFT